MVSGWTLVVGPGWLTLPAVGSEVRWLELSQAMAASPLPGAQEADRKLAAFWRCGLLAGCFEGPRGAAGSLAEVMEEMVWSQLHNCGLIDYGKLPVWIS